MHNPDDVNGGPKAMHHTLGPTGNQASPGNHVHDGGSSTTLPDVETLKTQVATLQTNYTALEARVYALEHP